MKCIYCCSCCIKRGKIKGIQRYQCKSCNRFQQNSNNEGINPYAPGSRSFRAFENNRNNPNLWNNRSTFSWAGSGQSEWIRNFNRAFGTLLLVGATGPLAGELAGAAAVGAIKAAAATPTFISNVSYYSRYALVRSYSTYRAVVSSELYFKSLGYTSKIMAVPVIQFIGGLGIDYYGQSEDITPPDLSTGVLSLDKGIEAGSLLYWYQKEIKRIIYENNKKEGAE